MSNVFAKKSRYNSILIPIMIFIIAYSFLSYNIDGQGRHVDEGQQVGFSLVFFDHTMDGDLLDPCITGRGTCDEICAECDYPGEWINTGGFAKGMLVGIGDSLFNDNERIFYNSCLPGICSSVTRTHDMVPGVTTPTQPELGAARFTVTIIGALTSVLAYGIGKQFFNRFVGLSFSIVLLFHSLWFIYSRTVMSETFVNFFMILSLFLLLLSLNANSKVRLPYFILSAIIFAVAINTKLPIIQAIPFFMIWIFLRQPFHEKLNFSVLKNKKYLLKSFILVFLFSITIIASVFATYPYYYIDPIGQLKIQYENILEYRAISTPWQETKNPYLAFVETFSVTLVPIFDTYYYLFEPDNIPTSATYGHTFTSIPLSLFFVIGTVYLFFNIVKRKLSFAEFLIIIWYLITYIGLSLTTESYNSTRYFLPLIFPMIIIASYGLWRFVGSFERKRIKMIFLSLFVVSHVATIAALWKDLYFEPLIVWVIPVALNLKFSLANPIVLSLGITFLIFSLIISIKKAQLNRVKNRL